MSFTDVSHYCDFSILQMYMNRKINTNWITDLLKIFWYKSIGNILKIIVCEIEYLQSKWYDFRYFYCIHVIFTTCCIFISKQFKFMSH